MRKFDLLPPMPGETNVDNSFELRHRTPIARRHTPVKAHDFNSAIGSAHTLPARRIPCILLVCNRTGLPPVHFALGFG